MLLFPAVLVAQEPEHPTDEPIIEYEFDSRCMAPMQWAAVLISARQKGLTVEDVVTEMVHAHFYGNLQGTSDAVMEYMLSIVATVYEPETLDKESIAGILQRVEQACLDLINPKTSI